MSPDQKLMLVLSFFIAVIIVTIILDLAAYIKY